METDLYELLFQKQSPVDQLLTAVQNDSDMVERLEDLINKGVDIDQVVHRQGGNRATHVACQKGNRKCLKRLLDAGACPDASNDFGITPLTQALRCGREECATLLLAYGGARNTTDIIWPSSDWSFFSVHTIILLLRATPSMEPFGQPILDRIYTQYIQQKLPEDLIKVFYLTGNVFSTTQFTSLLNTVPEHMAEWLRGFHTRCDLQHRARITIRRQLRPNVLYAVTKLPLPSRLQEYLLLENFI